MVFRNVRLGHRQPRAGHFTSTRFTNMSRRAKQVAASGQTDEIPGGRLHFLAPYRSYGILCLIAATSLVLGLWTFDGKLSLSGDNAEFIILAQSLAQGRGMSHIHQPEPRLATKFPFGFPLMLAPLEWAFPGSWVPMKGLVLVLFVLAMLVYYALVKDKLGTGPALVAAALSLSHPLLLDYAHQIMSEVPYLLFSLLALWLLGRSMQKPGIVRNYAFIGGGLCAVWAYQVRSIGLVLIGAAVVYLLVQRCYKKAAVLGGSALLLGLPWAWRNYRAAGESYFDLVSRVNPYAPALGQMDAGEWLQRLVHQASVYLGSTLPATFWPSFRGGGSLANPVSIILIALGLAALGLCLYRRQHLLLGLYIGLFAGTLLVWPWSGDRFLAPIVPLIIFFGVWVGATLGRALSISLHPSLGLVLGLSAVLLAVPVHGHALVQLARRGQAAYPPAWEHYYRAGQWLKEETPSQAVIACRKPYWLYVVSGRRCVPYQHEPPDSLIAHLQQVPVDYVVVESLGFSSTPRFLLPAIRQQSRHFDAVWGEPKPPTVILRFIATPERQ